MVFRRRLNRQGSDPGTNPDRTPDLFAITTDGYIIAQDLNCQYEFIEQHHCARCEGQFLIIAQINRAFQGLNEVVAICRGCGQNASFIFDISNDIYQSWWAAQMGDLYVRTFDGPARVPASAPSDAATTG